MRNVTDVGRDAVDAGGALTSGADADGEVAWSDAPTLASSCESNFRWRGWQKSPVTRESAKETVKTIARGMPVISGVTVVTNARATYHTTRGCGRIGRPAFPAALLGVALRPLIPVGTPFRVRLARSRGEIAKLWLQTSCLKEMGTDLLGEVSA